MRGGQPHQWQQHTDRCGSAEPRAVCDLGEADGIEYCCDRLEGRCGHCAPGTRLPRRPGRQHPGERGSHGRPGAGGRHSEVVAEIPCARTRAGHISSGWARAQQLIVAVVGAAPALGWCCALCARAVLVTERSGLNSRLEPPTSGRAACRPGQAAAQLFDNLQRRGVHYAGSCWAIGVRAGTFS